MKRTMRTFLFVFLGVPIRQVRIVQTLHSSAHSAHCHATEGITQAMTVTGHTEGVWAVLENLTRIQKFILRVRLKCRRYRGIQLTTVTELFKTDRSFVWLPATHGIRV